jgi:hypothetical protein
MDTTSSATQASPQWQHLCLRRLHHLLELTPNAAPTGLDEVEAFALIEWCRMAVFSECHAAGVGTQARAMLRSALRQV